MDNRFRVEVISRTPNPQQAIYAAMHQDYSEGFVCDERNRWPQEQQAGEIVVRRLLSGERGHYGPLEHPSIIFNVGGFPHSVMQQARTHRVGVSFDVQSGRYTGRRVCAVARGEMSVEEVFYLRPLGMYRDRQGDSYTYGPEEREKHRQILIEAACSYQNCLERGMAEEHARGLLPFDIRQNFVVSFNLRSALHFMDLRSKKDAQLEIQQMCQLMWPHLKAWVPQIAEWYEQARLGRARLAP